MQLTNLLPFALAALVAAAPTEQPQSLDVRSFPTCSITNMGTKAGLTAASKIIAAKSGNITIGKNKVVLASATANGQKTTVSALTVQNMNTPTSFTVTYKQLAEWSLNVISQCSWIGCTTLQGQPDCLVAGIATGPGGDLQWLEVHVDGDYNGPISR